MSSDKTSELFGIQASFVRNSLKKEERNHTQRLNELIELGIQNGEAYDQVEEGLFYFVSTCSQSQSIESILSSCKEPIVEFPGYQLKTGQPTLKGF